MSFSIALTFSDNRPLEIFVFEHSCNRQFRGNGNFGDSILIILFSWEEYNTTENNGEEDAKPYLLLWRLR